MKVLVTGASGFIGANICAELNASGIETLALLRKNSDEKLLKSHSKNTKIVRFESYEDLKEIFEHETPECIVHLAAHYAQVDSFDNIAPLIETNITFATCVLECAVKHGLKGFIYACSSWQYQNDFEQDATNLYAASKNALSEILNYYTKLFKVNVVRLVLYDVYGPGDPRSKLFATLPELAISKKTLELSPGEQLLDIVHINDVRRAFLKAAQILNSKSRESDFHLISAVRTHKLHSLKHLLNLFNSICGRRLELHFGAKNYRNNEVMRPPNLQSRLPEWKAEIYPEEGLSELWKHALHK